MAIILLTLLSSANLSFADNVQDVFDSIDTSILDDIASNTILGSFSNKVAKLLNGEYSSIGDFLLAFFQVFFDGVTVNLPSILSILAICILYSFVGKNNGLLNSSGNVVYFVCSSTVMVSVLATVLSFYDEISTLLFTIREIVQVALPIILTLVSATGGLSAVGVFKPSVVILSNTIIEIVLSVILPAYLLSLVFYVITNLGANIKLEKLSQSISNGANWLLGVIFTIFSSFLTLQGISANSFDSITAKAAKFATKNYIPILGSYLSDGFDLVLSSATLVKNSFGLGVLLLCFFVAIVPIVNILTYSLLLQLVSALSEPFDDKFCKFISGVSKNLTNLIVVVVAVYFMLVILIMLTLFSATLV
ncbi:MAG: stage III sporulation protein AE [Clostridia bacterium]|nr:stage III sporulation protein AE [Clostridia bacterium]